MAFLYLLKLYGITLVSFFLIDMLWLGLIARQFYRRHLAFLMRPQVNRTAALLFYAVFIIGILIFAVLPSLRSGSFGGAVLLGALFGFFTYATYDMTNLATLRDWPLAVVIVDICWGTLLCAATAAAGYAAGRYV
ncbi:DUF2177 family protein [bacterium]|nr:DUF2177 family protein [bacterium]